MKQDFIIGNKKGGGIVVDKKGSNWYGDESYTGNDYDGI